MGGCAADKLRHSRFYSAGKWHGLARPYRSPALPHMIYLTFSFSHHGRYSSYHRLVDYREPGDGVVDASLPGWLDNPVGNPGELIARSWRRRQEAQAIMLATKGGHDWLHYIYPEHGCRLLHKLGRGKCRVAMTCHLPGLIVDSPIFPQGFKLGIQQADALIAMSPDIVPYYRQLVPPARVEFIPHGIDVDFFRPPPTGHCGSETSPDRPVVLTVGNMMRDFDTLAAVINQAATPRRTIRFRVVANRERINHLRKLLTPAALRLLEPHSGIGDEHLRRLYHTSDLLFLPLTGATANNALLEAMACGLPMLLSDLPACRAYAEDDAFYLSATTPAVIMDQIFSLIADRERLAHSTARLRCRAESTLAWPVVAARQRAFLLETT